MRNAAQIIEQCHNGLITKREARASLRRLAKQARFNADYADDPASFTRWTRETRDATRALFRVPA